METPTIDNLSLDTTTRDFHFIKKLLQPLMKVFSVVIDRQPLESVSSVECVFPHGQLPPVDLQNKIPTFKVEHTEGLRGSSLAFCGAEAFRTPDHVSAYWQRAIRKFGIGHLAISFLFPTVEKMMKDADKAIKVTWCTVKPAPTMNLSIGGVEAATFDHSVICIDTQIGGQFVFDPTGEQFGLRSDFWFMEQEHYRVNACKTALFTPVTPEGMQAIKNAFRNRPRARAFELDVESTLDVYKSLPVNVRDEWLDGLVRQMLQAQGVEEGFDGIAE